MPNPEQGVLVQISREPSFASCYRLLLSMPRLWALLQVLPHHGLQLPSLSHTVAVPGTLSPCPFLPSVIDICSPSDLSSLFLLQLLTRTGTLVIQSCFLPSRLVLCVQYIDSLSFYHIHKNRNFTWFCPTQPGNQHSAEHRVHLRWCEIVSNVCLHFTREKMGTQGG